MTTVRVRIPSNILRWIKENINKIHKDMGFHGELSDGQVVYEALYRYKSYVTGKEYDMNYNDKTKSFIIKER